MNARDLSEIRRRLTPDDQNLACIRGCFVSSRKEIVSMFRLSPFSMGNEEYEKYISLFRKVLSGVPEKNLVQIAFADGDVGQGDAHKLLMALREDALEDDGLAEVLFHRLIDGMEEGESFLILLAYDAYDVPFRDGSMRTEGGGTVMFRYILCAVCPVRLSKPSLVYSPQDRLFHPEEVNWTVGAPETGFMFPAFEDRGADIYHAMFYSRDPSGDNTALVQAAFEASPPMAAEEQKEAFREILETSLQEDCSLEVMQTVHERLCEQIAQQKQDKQAPPAKVSAPQIRQALEVCGVSPYKVADFEDRYRQQFGGGMDASTVNVVDPRRFEVRTPNVVIRVDPARSDLVETRVIDGSRYILIRADEGVEVNGINVSIMPL